MVPILDKIGLADLDQLDGWEGLPIEPDSGHAFPAFFVVHLAGIEVNIKILTAPPAGATPNLPDRHRLHARIMAADDPAGGLNAVTADIVLDPRDPNAVYRATSGTVTIEALPLVQGDRAAGSFNFSAPQAADTSGETALSATGSFDFVADNTSIMCNRPDRGNQ